MVEGTFEGILSDFSNELGFVTGSFRSKITDQYTEATVSGRTWVDLNENNSRDLDEENLTINGLSIWRETPSNLFDLGTEFSLAADGTYTFTGLRPGTHRLWLNKGSREIVDFQIGDPTKDNDFIEANSRFESVEFTLTDGEHLENLDIGFKTPSSLHINSFGSSGCSPNINLSVIFQGGLGPYTVELSDGQSVETGDNFAGFSVTTGGEYTITVTDALGNSDESTKTVSTSTNIVSGFVWKDVDGNTEGKFDQNFDEKFEGLEIKLFDSNDVLIQTTLSENFNYNFFNVPGGDYYIEVEAPVDHEFTIVHPGDFLGNHVDPLTGHSHTFTLADCDDAKRANVGLKDN